MPLPYRKVKDMYDTLHDAGVVTQTLPEWSDEQNKLSESDLYSAGLHDNLIKRASVGIDRLLESTGLPALTKEFGGEYGSLFGDRAAGERVGEGLPRMGVNMGSFLIPGAGWAAGAARLGIAGLMSGAETYTETGSPAAGVLGGATVAALPGITGAAEKAVASRGVGALGQFLTGQAAAAGVMEGGAFGQDVVQGQPLHNPVSVDTLLNLTLGQAPFGALHLAGKVIGRIAPSTDTMQHAIDETTKLRELKDAKTNMVEAPFVPESATPEVMKETQVRLAKLRGEQVSIKDDPTIPADEKIDKLNALLNDEYETSKQHVPQSNSVFGDSIVEDSPRQQVVGRELKSNDKWRAIEVADLPVNPEELRGKVVTYSRAYEPNPTTRSDGGTVFGLPDAQWRTIKTPEEWGGRFAKKPDGTPDLPTQDRPASEEQYYSHIQDLKKVETEASTAQTPADLQKAVVRLQGVQHENDIPPTNDATIKKTVAQLTKLGTDPTTVVQTAVKVETKRTERKLSATREKERSVPPLSPEEAAKVSAQMGEGGFSVITADKLSHKNTNEVAALPKDETANPFHNIVEEAAYTVTNPDVKTKPEDVGLFRTLVGEFGTLKDLSSTDIEDVAQLIADRDGVTLAESKDDINHFLTQPHVAEWSQKLEEQVSKVREDNAGPGGVKPPPGERLVTVRRADGSTYQASFGDKYWEGGRASIAKLTSDGKWSHGILGEGEKIIEPMKAGQGFLFSLAPYDPVRNLLGGKHTLPKTGQVDESVLRNIGGSRGKPLTAAEMDLYRTIVPEAFEGGKVNVPKLVKGLEEKGPQVEVRKLGVGHMDELQQRYARVQHELDTFNPHWNTLDEQDLIKGYPESEQQRVRGLLSELTDINVQMRDEPPSEGRGQYSFLGPKPESEMPGYVEGLVRVPREVAPPGQERGDRLDRNIQYRGPHFGSEDTNVLAFYRGYEETLPDGTKAFHVIEVQSDWGQAARKVEKPSNYKFVPNDHPLLKVYESLALKAAIQHAKEVGATKVILSDAETAMMTEGHDRNPQITFTPGEYNVPKLKGRADKDNVGATLTGRVQVLPDNDFKAELERPLTLGDIPKGGDVEAFRRRALAGETIKFWRPGADFDPLSMGDGVVWDRIRDVAPSKTEAPQEKGMRLHYDQTLPSAMEKLTGEKGERVEVGTHKMAVSSPADAYQPAEGPVTGSPVFKDPSGAPKTQITGRVYDISHLPGEFTVTEPNAAPHVIPFVPESPTDIKLVERLNLPEGGVGLHKFLLNDKSPLIRALGKDLEPYKDSLSRIDVMVGETKSGMASATDMGNGRTQIVIPPASIDSPILGFTVAHELVHGLTISELNNPTKADLVKQFDGIRERLIKALPKDQQARLQQLESSDWRSKYASGEIGFDTIAPNATAYEKTILYSLVNTKEMVAQGLSSQQMQRFMRSVKGDKTGSWFNKFTNTVKELLGFKTDDSIFNEFLSRTNQLIEHGDYLASFREFSERYYENLGVSDSVGLGNTRRALGVILDAGFGTTKEDILNRLGNDVGVRSAELYSAKRDLNNMVTEGGDSFKDMSLVMSELGFEPTIQGADDFVQDVLRGEVSNYHDALDMLPGEASKYVFAKARDMNDVLGVLKAATNEKNKGLINLTDPAALRGPVADAIKALGKIAEVQQVHELGQQLVEHSMALEPDRFAAIMDSAPDTKTLDEFGNDDVRKPGSVSKFLAQASRMARRFPTTAELIDRVYELGPNAANMKGNILKVFGVDLKAGQQAITKDGLAESVKSISTPRTLNAVNRWMYWNQESARKEDRGVTMLPIDHPEVAKLLQGLSTSERDAVIDTVTKQSVSTQVMQSELLEKMHKTGVTMGANIVMADRGMKTQDSVQVANQLFNALRADRTNPQLAQQADAEIAVVQSKMTPEGFLELLKYTQAETEKFKLWGDYFKENPAWATAQRLERFLVSFTRGKEKKQLQASSVKEANVIAEGGKNVEITDQWKGTDDYFPSTDFGPILDRVSELEQNQLRSLKSKGYLDEAGAGDFGRMSIASQLARENAAGQAGVPKFEAPPRKLSQGADELPWFWNHVAHAERVSNFWSRKLLRAQSTLHLNDPELKAVPELQSWAKQHVENVLQPDPAITQRINRFVSTWFMGYAPASAMMNGFQTISTAVPELTSINGGRILDSYAKWGKAVAAVTKESLPGGKWSDLDHTWFSKQMSEAHEWDFSMYSDEAATQEAASTNFKRVMMKQKPQTVGQKLGTLAGTYTNVGMWMFKSVERFNNKVASLMAFDHYMGEGMTKEDALVEAKRFNRSVNYSGGRANRPVGAFDNAGSGSRSVAMLATNMQGYNLGVVGQIADYLQRGFFRPVGVTPAETYAARKAGLQMMATQMVAAGALGLPFASGAVALLNTLFPDLEINRHIREWAKSFFDGDKENGSVLGDIALTGLPSMIGWDMQSRLSMGNIVPGVTEYNGFQPEALLGPPANLVAGFVNGAMRVAGGDPKGGYSFVPPGVRKLFQLAANDGKVNDYKDRPLFQPTVGEQAGIALGFQPKRLTDFNVANRIAEQNQLVSTRREGRFHQQQAEEVLAGNFGTVRQTLLQRASAEKSFDPRTAVRAVSQAAEELTFPRDLRREGTTRTGAERNKLLSTFNLPPSEPSEVDRLNFRQGIQQRLGLPPQRGSSELRAAQMIDQLQKDNPSATRSQLRQMVEQTLHSNRQTSSLLPE